jgi:hypothetical protein
MFALTGLWEHTQTADGPVERHHFPHQRAQPGTGRWEHRDGVESGIHAARMRLNFNLAA